MSAAQRAARNIWKDRCKFELPATDGIADLAAIIAELEQAALTYYMGYVQDEAEELECCLDEKQHEAAKDLRDALAKVRGK